MGDVSVSAAATELGVSERQVARLARAGDLDVTREVGGAFLLDSASVHRLAQMRRQKGRPWNEAVAWAALAWLSGEETDWLSASQMTRLKHRLRRSNAEDVAFFARRRAVSLRMRGWGDTGSGVIGRYLAGTGVSALGTDSDTASRFGLATTRGKGADGYVTVDELDTVVEDLGLTDDREGDVTVRVVSKQNPYFTATKDTKTTNTVTSAINAITNAMTTAMTTNAATAAAARTLPLAAVAVDLMDSLDTRERSAGARVLQELLDARR